MTRLEVLYTVLLKSSIVSVVFLQDLFEVSFQSCLFSICFYDEFLNFSLQKRKGIEECTFHLTHTGI